MYKVVQRKWNVGLYVRREIGQHWKPSASIIEVSAVMLNSGVLAADS